MSFSAAKPTFLMVFLKPPATNKEEEEEKQSHFAAWTEHYPFAHPTQKEEKIYIYIYIPFNGSVGKRNFGLFT